VIKDFFQALSFILKNRKWIVTEPKSPNAKALAKEVV
jgi:hypothetical protein